MKKITVTIGIAAYNEERSIKALLLDLTKQVERTIVIERIIVISDGSTDGTVEQILEVQDQRIECNAPLERRGKAERLNELFVLTKSDCLVVLDGDVRVKNIAAIETLVNPIRKKQSDMTSGSIKELPPRTFIEKSLLLSMQLKKHMFDLYRNGHNVYHCHGPIRAFSRELYQKLRFDCAEGEDMYSYFACKQLNMRFTFVSDVWVSYRLPKNVLDHQKQSERFTQAKHRMADIFGASWVLQEFSIPIGVIARACIKFIPAIVREPLHFLTYVGLYSWTRVQYLQPKKRRDTWNILSTKTA